MDQLDETITEPSPEGSTNPDPAFSEIENALPLLTIEVALPSDVPVGTMVFAGLKDLGSQIAIGSATTNGAPAVTLTLTGISHTDRAPSRECELWITINRDDFVSCYPAFGDTYRIESVIPARQTEPLQIPADGWTTRALSAPENLVTLHYHRFDDTYDNVGIWSWDYFQQRSPAQNELFPVGTDDFGLVFQLDRADYGANDTSQRVGLLVRMGGSWDRKDGGDYSWVPSLGSDIYLIGRRSEVYTTPPPTTPHVSDAFIDTLDILHLHCSHPVAGKQVKLSKVHLIDDLGNTIDLKHSHLIFADSTGRSKVIEVIAEAPLDPTTRCYRLGVDGLGPEIDVVPRDLLDDREIYFDRKAVLGATYEPYETVFRVFAPTVKSATLLLFDTATDDSGHRTVAMERAGKGIWHAKVEGNLDGTFYNYRFEAKGLLSDVPVTDPYATNTVNSGRRARITAPGSTDPHEWEHLIHGPKVSCPLDTVIWEVHVRDLTTSPSSGAKHPGLYTGFAEQGTHHPDDPSLQTGIEHMLELGVTHVQILPVQDSDNEESQRAFNWGYMSNYFNSPDGVYASDIYDESRVREFKELVAALHERGIGVILDVVYNHTGASAPFDRVVPQYYYRMLPGGHYANGSGCGNEFRSGSPMGRKYIIETLSHWVTEYGIDGFRFDLMSLIDIDTMREVEKELRKVNPDILLYGEPWQAAESPLRAPSNKFNIQGTGIGAFNDDFRNAVKGSPDGDGHGFIQSGVDRDRVEMGLEGSARLWSGNPQQVVNYLTCHDNLTLFDKLKASRPDASDELMTSMMRLAHLILFTSQGIPFLHAGCEFARTKFGDHNSYQSTDSTNQIDWSLKQKNTHLFHYVHGLIALRKAHPLFRLSTNSEIKERIAFHHAPTGDTIIFTIDGKGIFGETWSQACILFNASDSDSRDFKLPEGSWKTAYDAEGNSNPERISEQLTVAAKSGLILFQR